jgi:hypothetical protein
VNPVEGRYVSFTMPLYYETVEAYVRTDDQRFDGGIEAVNDPAVTVAAVDGALNGIIAQQDFPKATIKSLPNMTDTAQVLEEVGAGKADIAFAATQDGRRFALSNPGKIRNLAPGRPLRAFPAAIGLPQNDVALKGMLDSAFVQLHAGRFIDKTLASHDLPSDVVYRIARPYEAFLPSGNAALSNATESAKNVPTQ